MTTALTDAAGPGSRRSSTRSAAARRASTLTAYRWEVTKLAALVRTRAMLAACLIAPPIVVLVLRGQTPPADTLYGRYIHASGYAVPLLLLGFASQWVFPLLTSLVAGDIFASEDHLGTWKTVLTRSVSRGQLFSAKTLAATTFAVAVFGVLAASTIVSSVLLVGHQPLIGLTGQTIPSGTAVELVVASWATDLAPLIGFTALSILLSVRTRNPAVGVVGPVVLGFAMALVGSIGGIGLLRRAMLTTSLESWHGLLVASPFTGPLVVGVAVSAAWTVVCLFFAYTALRRRDITGG
jgi:ABC-2 type transport system permease protein